MGGDHESHALMSEQIKKYSWTLLHPYLTPTVCMHLIKIMLQEISAADKVTIRKCANDSRSSYQKNGNYVIVMNPHCIVVLYKYEVHTYCGREIGVEKGP